ncbi:MAG: prephenate dehydrogenase [Candidatus Omnitrophica bacterium]|nr:prephenate dehydrogenase [Candidatus Omnitrophota bacterium]
MFKKAIIIGTGLIGGSLGLAMKKKKLARTIVGFSRHLENARLAKKMGAIDCIGKNLGIVKDADLIILATPVKSIIEISSRIKDKINKNCIVIDVGSTKQAIVARLDPIIPNFVGCHPLAGSEKRGASNLGNDIFKDSICILTPTPLTNLKTLNKIRVFWQKLGAKVVLVTPEKHDRALAFTSHLPHAIAFALISSIPDNFLSLSSKGLKDVARISGSDSELWVQIFLSNKQKLLTAINTFQKKISALKLALENNNTKLLTGIIKKANKQREKLG